MPSTCLHQSKDDENTSAYVIVDAHHPLVAAEGADTHAPGPDDHSHANCPASTGLGGSCVQVSDDRNGAASDCREVGVIRRAPHDPSRERDSQRPHLLSQPPPRSTAATATAEAPNTTFQMLSKIFFPFPNSIGQLRRRIRRFVAHVIATYAIVGNTLLQCVTFFGLAAVSTDELFAPGDVTGAELDCFGRSF